MIRVILSGGSGTRLWPLSRERYPKERLPLRGDDSMLQATARRLDGFAGAVEVAEHPIVVCNEEYRFLTAEQMRQIGKKPAAILLEPAGRNTRPRSRWRHWRHGRGGADPILLVMAEDHVVADLSGGHRRIYGLPGRFHRLCGDGAAAGERVLGH